jgi:hypothetical protein
MAKSFAIARDAFDHLLDTYESQPERKTSILAEPDYAGMDADAEARFHRTAQLAAESGAIKIDMRRRPDEHLIKTLRLIDPEKLYAYTGRARRPDEAKAAWARAETLLKRMPEWLEAERVQAIATWSRHRTWRGLEIADAREAGLALVLAAALEDGAMPGTSYRAFSAEHAQDSKALRRSEMVVSGILRDFRAMPLPQDNEEPLAAFGIMTFPDPILLRGPFAAGSPPVSLSASKVYAAVTPPNADTIAWASAAPYVLTIENKESFNAYVHRVPDDGAVVFTGGFPSVPCITLLQKIAASAPHLPWYHWGDIDSGGLRIFDFVEREVCRPAGIRLKPHLMDESLARAYGQKPKSRASDLKRIADSNSAIAPLARFLLSAEARILEQELTKPSSPLCIIG